MQPPEPGDDPRNRTLDQYVMTFHVELKYPPKKYRTITFDQLAQYGDEALHAGRPVNWAEVFKKL